MLPGGVHCVLHENPSFAPTSVHEELDDLVVEILQLEHDEILLAVTRSYHLIFDKLLSPSVVPRVS